MKVFFYKNNSNNISVKKNISLILECDCLIDEDCSILQPSLVVRKNIKDANYLYIPDYNRYYFIKDIIISKGFKYKITTYVDVLYTYKDAILSSKQNIIRQQYEYNMYVRDENIPNLCGVQRQVLNFTEPTTGWKLRPSNLDNTSNCFIMNTI